jgi:hypothetical protein
MFARLVLPFYAIVSDAVFLVSSLYEAIVVDLLPHICGRSRAGAPQ